MKLVIGNKKYSSWSFRPWFLLKMINVPFEEISILIRQKDSYEKIRRYSPGGRVPALIDGKVRVWESLAICEYIAEKFPGKKLWPENVEARAVAKSISSEMHAGFQAMRQNLPCHFVARHKNFPVPADAQADIDRIFEIWRGCRKKWGKDGPFLFGKFSVADAMFAPVAFRLLAYSVKMDAVSKKYAKTITSLPVSRAWVAKAAKEKATIPAYEFHQDKLGRHE